MPPKKTQAASLEEWEQHKETMRKLFIDDDQQLDQVIKQMEVEHLFFASYVLVYSIRFCSIVTDLCGYKGRHSMKKVQNLEFQKEPCERWMEICFDQKAQARRR